MALVFSVGIPLAHAALLYRKLDIICPGVSDPKLNNLRESRGDDTRMSRTALRTTSATHERQLAREALEAKAKGVEKLKFLYKDYRPEAWYWEVLETMRRIVMTGALVVFEPG